MTTISRVRYLMAGVVLVGAGAYGVGTLRAAHGAARTPSPLVLAPGVTMTLGAPLVAYNGQNSVSAPDALAEPHRRDPVVHVDMTITNTGSAPFTYQPDDFTLVAQPGNVMHPYVAEEGEVYVLGRYHAPLPGGVVMPGTSARGTIIWTLNDDPVQGARGLQMIGLDNGWITFTPFKTLGLVYAPPSAHAVALPLARPLDCAGSPKTRQWWTCTPVAISPGAAHRR